MQCPKDRKIDLIDGVLAEDLAVKSCPECQGNWIGADVYETWQINHFQEAVNPAAVVYADVEFAPAASDTKAGLCPQCNRYLSRAKVWIKTPFYVERCPNCGGFWCDNGEWEILTTLGVEGAIEHLFSGDWQFQLQKMQLFEKERQATVDKLGPDVAAMVFELAEVLENHPNGDFGVAYLMRRFDKPQ